MVRLLANSCVNVYLSDNTNISAKKYSRTRQHSRFLQATVRSSLKKAGWYVLVMTSICIRIRSQHPFNSFFFLNQNQISFSPNIMFKHTRGSVMSRNNLNK